jgi:2-polyprenyl-3-methyl-5-hydroxy-6-metoxy-1,4-benzoquinol methylase
MACPFCTSIDLETLFPPHRGECVTSDLQIVSDSSISNMICNACGFIFNHGGPRGATDEFYRNAYRLRMQSDAAKNINFSSQSPVPMARAVAEFLIESGNLEHTGGLLEAGAGKGEFLSEFLSKRPNWNTVAFEPSDAAGKLAKRLLGTKVYRQNFQTTSIDETFDVVASLAVIEHVERPLEFLCWLRDRLATDGCLLVTFPDFARNPNDIFCVDHLSKITLPHFSMLADRAGLQIVATRHVGIALLIICKHGPRHTESRSVFAQADEIFRENERLALSMLAAVRSARDAAKLSGEKLAIFGLGMAGLIGPPLIGFDRSEISAYIDENETMQGATIGGAPVVGLEGIDRLRLKHIAVSASPIYRDQISQKLSSFDTKVYF